MKRWNGTENAGTWRMLGNLMILICAFFVMLLLAVFLGEVFSKAFPTMSRESLLTISACQNIIGFCGAALVTAYFTTERPLKFLGITNRCSWRPFAGVMIVLLAGLPFLNQVIYYNSLMHLPESMAGIEQMMRDMETQNEEITKILLDTNSMGGLLAGVLIIGVLTGFSEELLFRGTIQRTLNQDPGIGQWSIWITAFVFSAVHLQFYGFVPRMLLGAFFGYLLYSTGSIWPGAFAHAVNNSLVVATSWMESRGIITDSDTWAVVESGIPWPAILSLSALIIFFVFGYRFFFKPCKRIEKSLKC